MKYIVMAMGCVISSYLYTMASQLGTANNSKYVRLSEITREMAAKAGALAADEALEHIRAQKEPRSPISK